MHRLLAASAIAFALSACSRPEEEAPVTETATEVVSPAPANAEEDIRHFLLQEYPDAAPLKYALAWHDLDGDGADEAIVHLVTPYFCGSGGCNTLVLTGAGPMWRKVGEISVSRTPVSVLETRSNGWKDLTVAIGGGGGASGNALLKFDGTAYPSNPTVAPAEMTDATGTELLPEEPVLIELAAEEKSTS
ncbi:hypothetical protein G6N82_13645 [Altererythrobacter sp. BO-6]|uniref:hypothetical protein n=1 Tax=Altererythrobacter sp. BO-6 TaxID=2604537 RepID=UPI0013E1364F|nr:hypothetical protein [Altererythrobacter sp. BO-6]QIG55049.1 hypothetical protein G6N82_13645 [Altererythrobacter sp. BO-6]